MMMDFACVMSTVFFAVSNLLYIILRVKERQGFHFDFELWTDLDPFYLKYQWQHRMSNRALMGAAGLLSALAWFLFCIPIINVAWILSNRGKRKMGMHVLIGTLAIGGSIAELLARLMMVGISNVAQWLAKDFNLDHWKATSPGEETNDGTGWKVLEISYMLGRGIILWIDAFEWLALSGVLVLIFFSIRDYREHSPFGWKWSILGLAIGILSLFDFIAEILRFQSWRTFMLISLAISIINTLILMPIWLLMLGRQLPSARREYEGSEGEALVENLVSNGENNDDTAEFSNEEQGTKAIVAEGEMS